MKLESKVGKIPNKDQIVYNFLSNFNNFQRLIPADKLKNWQSDENSCSFSIDPVGRAGFKFIDKEPYKLLKLENTEPAQYKMNFWVQLKQTDEHITAIRLTMEIDLNPMLQMMAKKPLQEFLDKLVEQIEKMAF